MNEMGNRELQVALNKVCFSSDFKMFFTSRHHLCPRGMTISVVGEPKGETEQAKECFYLALVIREYGYDSSDLAVMTLLTNIWPRYLNTLKPGSLNCMRNTWMA